MASYARKELDGYRSGKVTSLGGGGVRLLNTPDATTLDHMPCDIEWLYDVSERNGKLWVIVQEIERPEGWSSDVMVASKVAEGTLTEMLERFKDWPQDDVA